jgi:predicted amidophosphoribosyltransferase
MKFCISCAEELEDEAKFCFKCGAKQAKEPEKLRCINCGAELPAGTKFCSECGANQAAKPAVVEPAQKTSEVAVKPKGTGLAQQAKENKPKLSCVNCMYKSRDINNWCSWHGIQLPSRLDGCGSFKEKI